MNARSWAAIAISSGTHCSHAKAEDIVAGLNMRSVAVIDLRTALQMIGAFQAIRELQFFPNLEADIDAFIGELMDAAGVERTNVSVN